MIHPPDGLKKIAVGRPGVIGKGPGKRLPDPVPVVQGDFPVDAIPQIEPVEKVFRAGQDQFPQFEIAGIEVDRASHAGFPPASQFNFKIIGEDFPVRQSGRVMQIPERHKTPDDRRPHFLPVISGKSERDRFADQIEFTPAPDHLLRRLVPGIRLRQQHSAEIFHWQR